MPNLSARKIETAKVDPTKDIRISDGQGLYLKVAKYGTKTFVYRFKYGPGRHELTLGTYPSISLSEARERRLEANRVLDGGRNPLHVHQAEEQAKQDALTVDQLIVQFHENFLKLRFQKPDEALKTLNRDIGRELGKYLVPDVTKKEVVNAINKILLRGSKVAANRTLTLVRRMFEYAVTESMIEDNPVKMTRDNAGGKEASRVTNLSFEQLSAVLHVLEDDDADVSWQCRLALKLLIATGKRPGEICTMEWAHVDLDRKVWINPEHLTKEKHGDHKVFLSPYAVRILRLAKSMGKGQKYVWPSPKFERQHIDRHSLSRVVLRLRAEGVLKSKFTPHDLRRTYASRMGELGQPGHVVEKTLDHLMGGVRGIYDRNEYLPERQAAMNAWGAKLEQISQR